MFCRFGLCLSDDKQNGSGRLSDLCFCNLMWYNAFWVRIIVYILQFANHIYFITLSFIFIQKTKKARGISSIWICRLLCSLFIVKIMIERTSIEGKKIPGWKFFFFFFFLCKEKTIKFNLGLFKCLLLLAQFFFFTSIFAAKFEDDIFPIWCFEFELRNQQQPLAKKESRNK